MAGQLVIPDQVGGNNVSESNVVDVDRSPVLSVSVVEAIVNTPS